MSRRPEALETTRLVIELLRRIPRGARRVTASDLHQQLKDAGIERELRTIQRQLEMLCEHFDIECDNRSKPYRYRWLEKSSGLTIPMLTPQQALLLHLAEVHLKNILPAKLAKSMDSFFVQARNNLTQGEHAQREREWPGKVRVVAESQPLLPPKTIPGVFETVSEALYENAWLRVDYRNAAGQRSLADIMPLGLAQQGPRLYLVCRYKGYADERSLALHRILAAEKSTFHFERPRDFNLKKYDADGRFGFGEGKRIRLTFRIQRHRGEHLLETPLSTDQAVREIDDDHLEISATVVDSAMLEWWLRGFGEAVREVKRDDLAEEPGP